MIIRTSDIPTSQMSTLAGLIDAAYPSCRWKKLFSVAVNVEGLEAAYERWKQGPIVNTFILPKIEELIEEIKVDYAKRQAP